MARNDPQFNLRVPAELKIAVEEAAKKSGRSINAEAVYRLEQSFSNQTTSSQLIDLSQAIADLKAEIQSLKEKPTAWVGFLLNNRTIF